MMITILTSRHILSPAPPSVKLSKVLPLETFYSARGQLGPTFNCISRSPIIFNYSELEDLLEKVSIADETKNPVSKIIWFDIIF